MTFGMFTGIEALAGLVEELDASGADVRLARVHAVVLERLGIGGVLAKLGEGAVSLRVEDAIAAAGDDSAPLITASPAPSA